MRWVSRSPPRPASGDSALLSFVSLVDCVSGPGKVGFFLSSSPAVLFPRFCFSAFLPKPFSCPGNRGSWWVVDDDGRW